MRLPNSGKAVIPREKLINYILSETHSTGKFKARFFLGLGFNERNVSLLEGSLYILANSEEIQEEYPTIYGIKYVLEGKMNTPSGRIVKIRTVWIIEHSQSRPRFITMYPL